MKKFSIILASALIGCGLTTVVSSCSEDGLDIENGNSLNTSNFWKTESDAEKGVVASLL